MIPGGIYRKGEPRCGSLAMENRNRLTNRWSVFKENHPTAHICVMIIAVNIIFILASALIIMGLPENQGQSLGQIIRLAFTLMVNPSGKYTYSDTAISRIITTIVVLLGMISLTGGTVGFITSLINGVLEKTAHSKRTLRLNDHIVILNYNQRVPAILLDYCFDDVNDTYIVILTEEDKETVEKRIAEVHEQYGGNRRFRHVIVRSGSPQSAMDLDRIGLSRARTVLLMTPDSADADGLAVSKQFLFISEYLSEKCSGHAADLVVETSGEGMDSMIRRRLRKADQRVTTVPHEQLIGKLLGITAMMPSISGVLRQLFSFEGIEVYTRPIPGDSIVNELKRNRSALPLFDMDGYRVYVSENESEFSRVRDADYRLEKPLPSKPLSASPCFSKNEIVIVGINRKLPYILESLSCFKRQYHIDELRVILAGTAEQYPAISTLYADSTWHDILEPDSHKPILIHDMYRPMDDLSSVVEKTADTLLFLSDDDAGSTHMDEKPLLYWADIQGRMNGDRQDRMDVVMEIHDPANQSIIHGRNRSQILISDDFLGRFYAQLGKNPMRKGIIMDMITSEGDTASVGEGDELNNSGDLMCLRVSDFLSEKDRTFRSKRELILWIYEATNRAVLPIGISRGGEAYLFSRTDSDEDSLDSCILEGIREGQILDNGANDICLRGDDEIVAFLFG